MPRQVLYPGGGRVVVRQGGGVRYAAGAVAEVTNASMVTFTGAQGCFCSCSVSDVVPPEAPKLTVPLVNCSSGGTRRRCG